MTTIQKKMGARADSAEDSFQSTFWRRSCIVRPMPSGVRVYLVLVQFILYEIVSYSTELYLAHRFSSLLVDHVYQDDYRQAKGGDKGVPERVPAIFLVLRSFHLLFCLPMGFLADRYFGRTKVLIYSWIFLFVTQCLLAIHIAVFEAYTHHYLHYPAFIVLTMLICTVHAAGLAGVHVNLVPYGVDQLTGAFADELGSFFHCYYWCRSAGVFFVCTFSSYLLGFANAGYVLLVATVSCATGTVINLFGMGWFTQAGRVENPLLLIFRVLRYAVTAKRRVELANNYGGQVKQTDVSEVEVEDVKGFLRILGILSSLVGFFCVSFLLYSVYLKQALHLKFPQVQHLSNSYSVHCKQENTTLNVAVNQLHISPQWCLGIPTLTIMILIPLLDRIFYPMPYYQRKATIFNRIAIGMCFSMLSILCALVLEVWRELSDDVPLLNTVKAFDYLPSSMTSSKLYYVASHISLFAIIPQFVFQGVAEAFALVTIVELIYTHSPGYMKGVLLGCLFFTEGFAMLLGSLLFVVLSQIDGSTFRTFGTCYTDTDNLCYCNSHHDANGFAIGLYAVVVVIALISFVMFRCLVSRFVGRKREDNQVNVSDTII